MTDDIDIAQERTIADAATEGPWFTPDERRLQGAVSARIGERECQVASIDGDAAMFDRRAETHEIQRANAAFIARARTLVPRLLDALEQARKERDVARWADETRLKSSLALIAERDALRHQLEARTRERDEARESMSVRAAADGCEIGVLTAERNSLIYGNTVDAACQVRERQTAEAIAALLEAASKQEKARADSYSTTEACRVADERAEALTDAVRMVRAGAWRAKEGK